MPSCTVLRSGDESMLLFGVDDFARDDAILHMDDAISMLSDGIIMCDKDDRLSFAVEAGEKFHHFDFGLRVEVSGGLVCKNHERVVDE